MVDQWLARLGLSVARSTAPAKPAQQVIDLTPRRTLGEILRGEERKVRKTVTIDGHCIIETVTIAPMTADDLRRENDAWRRETRESQWRRLR